MRTWAWMLGVAMAQMWAGPSVAAQRPVAATSQDLPLTPVRISTTPSALLTAPDRDFLPVALSIEQTAQSLLDRYDIKDPATRGQLLNAIAQAQLLRGAYDKADANFAAMRAEETKADGRKFAGLQYQAMIAAERSGARRGTAAYDDAYAQALTRAFAPLDPAEMNNRMLNLRRQSLQALPNLFVGLAQETVDPLAKDGQLPRAAAIKLLGYRFAISRIVPLTAPTLKVLRGYAASHPFTATDVWTSRRLDLTGRAKLTPVRIAIWDTGLDGAQFPGKMLTGADGGPLSLAFDVKSKPSPGLLRPIDATMRKDLPNGLRMLSGLNDQQAGKDSPAALAARAKLATLKPEQVAGFVDSVERYGNFAHGTMVTSIAVEGNPAARIASVRNDFEIGSIFTPPTAESTKAIAAMYRQIGDWLAANRIRVVNLSWIGTLQDDEEALAREGKAGTPDQIRALAKTYFTAKRDAFRDAVMRNPDTLFVAGAGNSNNDTDFNASFPSGVELPNLIVVGGVDKAGEPMVISSFGKTVRVAANGQDMPVIAPGGYHLRDTGTSHAAPGVTNLAAKLWALHPTLTVAQVIDLITRTATPKRPGGLPLIDPARAAREADAMLAAAR